MKKSLLAVFLVALAPLVANAQWAITDIYNFTTFGNIEPPSSLIVGTDGNIYGVAYEGGTYGQIYKLALSWSGNNVTTTYTLLHQLNGSTDGEYPEGSLVEDNAGNFYGTASGAGANGHGVVFEYSSSGVYSVIYNFKGGTTDGCGPSGLTIVNSGSTFILYGTTGGCGSANAGTVYRMAVSGGVGSESILHSFAGGTKEGLGPTGGMILASDGYLYGTTNNGGANSEGTVFRISPSGGILTTVYNFFYPDSPNGNSVTQLPGASSLTLYGVSPNGGSPGYGLIYKLVEGTGGTFTFSSVHNFAGGTTDGKTAWGNLIYSPVLGYFFGTTQYGGTSNAGTFYEVTPAGSFGLLNSMTGGARNGPIWVQGGTCNPCVFGTTTQGGTSNDGTVWLGIAP
jgi:uncharacterized repeat protein (TIGR03803 family)